ncbi:methylmalonyl-CoA epimerase [Bacillus atrophaeus]|uniref:methylmalonyl-CoA epimerase n=1 Tax=Bacillus atrophaeus TaxID=1452 RepID=UPI0022804FBB|nr:methylmalonyl-CoA epimerase [Bacillus atrophaeus]MCY8496342.1 methylmalonyl-CoA epimerase [Bacillus atrophaeus]MCY8811186.1 methylmalonyl-CoA epimerase [Bacillus atrophaeus]MCY8821341.1 methylmalonyl-CoA epimerase [Bacillus atrophaeus]MCY8829040.1 methylmalonyl-CoA epimerase [Bacillus atrophaeus]MCY8834246.1 methylmalonyl-CoA epimerase [Bacillus atrophaeus]
MKKLDHIAIAVYSIEKERAFYERVLGLTLIDQEVIEDQQVKTAFFQAGETKLELIEPLTPDSPVGSFLEKKGQGLHHLAFLCSDLSEKLTALANQRIELIDREPRKGAGGKQIAFISPKETNGVLIELCEYGKKGDSDCGHERPYQ